MRHPGARRHGHPEQRHQHLLPGHPHGRGRGDHDHAWRGDRRRDPDRRRRPGAGHPDAGRSHQFDEYRGIWQCGCRRPGQRLDGSQQRGPLRVRGGDERRAARRRWPDDQQRPAQHLHPRGAHPDRGPARLPGHPGAAVRGCDACGRSYRRGIQRLDRRRPGLRRRRRAQSKWRRGQRQPGRLSRRSRPAAHRRCRRDGHRLREPERQ